jgi:uncharacterized protein
MTSMRLPFPNTTFALPYLERELPIIDCDSHYAENIEGLWRYMDEPWRTRLEGPRINNYLPRGLGDRWMEGRIAPDRQLIDTEKFDADDVQRSIVGAMDRLGVRATVLVPNQLTLLGHLSVRDAAVAMCRAHIAYHLEDVADAAKGIYTMPIVTWHDPEAAAELVESVAEHPAVAGVCLTCSNATPPWGDARYRVLFETVERYGLPLVLHADSGMTLTEHAGYADQLQSLIESHSLGFLVGSLIQLTSMVMQGVTIRHPRLKVLFLETGLFWVPMMMYRLDEYFVKRRADAPLLEALPSEYILQSYYFGTQPIEAPRNQAALAAVFDAADGRNHFVFASDYPHWDYDDPITIDRLGFLSRKDKARVFARNAMDLLRFDYGGQPEWHTRIASELSPSSRPVAG